MNIENNFTLCLHELNVIVSSLGGIERDIALYSFEQFKIDSKTQQSVIMQLEIIGYAIRELPFLIKQSNSAIPWEEFERFGFDLREKKKVGLNSIWRIAKNELPKYYSEFKEIRKQEYIKGLT